MTASPSLESPAPPASTFVTVLAWLGILYHGFLLFIGGLEVVVFRQLFSDPAAWRAMMPPSNAALIPADALQLGTRMFTFLFAAFLAWALVGLAASIALLHRRNWGRVITIVLLALGIAWMLVMLFGQWWMAGVPLPPQMEGAPDMSGMLRSLRMMMTVVSVVFAVGYGWLIAKLVSKPIRAEFVHASD